MDKLYNIQEIKFDSDYLIVKIAGHIYKFKLSEISDKLSNATGEEKNEYKVSPSGYGIHWKMINEDLSIKGLMMMSMHSNDS
jgi:hypothetical protein